MPTSTSTAAAEPGSPPSAASGSPSSPSSSKPLREKWGKVEMANYLRLMQDNDRTLSITAADNKAYRDQAQRMREAQMSQAASEVSPSAGPPTPPSPEPDMGNISIDSPVTTHFHYPTPAQPAPVPAPPAPVGPASAAPAAPASPSTASKLVPWVAGAALLVGGAFAGHAIASKPAATAPAPAPATATTTNTTLRSGFGLELGDPPPKP